MSGKPARGAIDATQRSPPLQTAATASPRNLIALTLVAGNLHHALLFDLLIRQACVLLASSAVTQVFIFGSCPTLSADGVEVDDDLLLGLLLGV